VKILIGILAVFAFILPYAHAQPTQDFDIYDNNAANAEITVSMNKFTYSSGEQASIVGFITTDYKQGQKVLLQLTDSYGTLQADLSVLPTKDGIFNVDVTLPKATTSGALLLSAKYGPNGTPVSLSISIDVITNETIVTIPKGAQFQDSGLNFDPDIVITEQGLPIKWVNNDAVVHTVVSAERNFRNKIIETDLFYSKTFAKNNPYVLTLYDTGDYVYYCKLHPWLVGQITIVKSTDPNYSPPKPKEVVTQNPFLNDGYVKIKTNKKIYFVDDIVRLTGSIQQMESGQPVTFQVFNPKQNIVSINQLTPKSKTLSFIIPLSGSQFSQGGNYTIVAQYGAQKHRTEVNFALEKPTLLQENYKGYDIYGGQQYYAISYGSGSLDDVLFSNLVKNPSFEYDLVDSKVPNWSAPKKPFTGKLDSTTVSDGRYSYRISSKSNDNINSQITSEVIPAKAGGVYYAEVFARATNIKNLEIRVETIHNGTWALIADLYTKKDKTDFPWTKFSKEFTIPKSSKNLRLVLNAGHPSDPKKTSDTWFDDITVRLSRNNKSVILLTADSIENLMIKIDKAPPIGPILVEENYKNYNLVMYAGKFYGFLDDYKKFNFKNISNSTIPFGKSIDDLKTNINKIIIKQKEETEKEKKVIEDNPIINQNNQTGALPLVEPVVDNTIRTLQIVVIIVTLVVGSYFGLRYYQSRKKVKS
jgi:plastocyanin